MVHLIPTRVAEEPVDLKRRRLVYTDVKIPDRTPYIMQQYSCQHVCVWKGLRHHWPQIADNKMNNPQSLALLVST